MARNCSKRIVIPPPVPVPVLACASADASNMSVSLVVIAAKPCVTPPVERSVEDVRPRLLAEPDQEADVVNRDEPEPEHLADHEQVAKIAPRIRRAGLTVALGVERLGRALERGAPHVDPAGRQPRR